MMWAFKTKVMITRRRRRQWQEFTLAGDTDITECTATTGIMDTMDATGIPGSGIAFGEVDRDRCSRIRRCRRRKRAWRRW